MGKVCVAFTNKTMLIVRQSKKPVYQYMVKFPVVSFALPKQVAKATSNKPAIIMMIQFIVKI
jgi:hypothetical protein